MILAVGALAALVGLTPELRAVRVTTIEERTAIRILTSEDVAASPVVREGGEVVVRIAARAAADLVLPPVTQPVAAIRMERGESVSVLRMSVAPEVPFETSHEPGLQTIVFGGRSREEATPAVSRELYARLFPIGSQAAEAPQDTSLGEEATQGLALGPVSFRPQLSGSWVDADIQAFESPISTRARYLQVGPGATASMPLAAGLLVAEYEVRLRFFSNLPNVDQPTHMAGARLELPVGSRVTMRAAHRFTRATLETNLVDPGREYFFDLSRYTLQSTTLGWQLQLGPRLLLDGTLGREGSRFDRSDAGFFTHESRTAAAGLGYDLGGDLRARVSYSYSNVPPPPDRALANTTAHAIEGSLSGQIGPVMTGSLSAGYRSQASPLAQGKSRSYRGLVLGGSLRRDLGHASTLELQLNRSSQLSGFESNSYYLNNAAALALSLPLPFGTWGRASVNGSRNDYPNDALATGKPRRDGILGWSVGLGRSIGWRTSLRLDYRRERRDSSIPGFDVTTDGFTFQASFGPSSPGSGAVRP